MKTFLVSYDLGVPETAEDYKKLITCIKSFGAWAKPLYSVWFIKSDKPTSQIRDQIKKETDANDSLLVLDVTGSDWATNGVDEEVISWMQDNL